MFKEKTFVVVGAGASTEVNIPDGGKLKRNIARSLNIRFKDGFRLSSGDPLICEALNIKSDQSSINQYLPDAHHICNAMPLALSIDNFVDTQPSNEHVELLAKLAIVNEIIKAEKQSSIYFDSYSGDKTLNFRRTGNTWLDGFFQLLTENCRVENLEQRLKSLVLVIFNYDRSVEHYLYHALRVYYRIEHTAAADLVNSMQIYHPYGTAGSLEWQKSGVPHPYGNELQPGKLLSLATQIRTFSEGVDPDSTDIEKIHQGLRDSGIVVFLGFAFHPLNMKLLRPTDQTLEHTDDMKCFATAYGQSESDLGIIEEQIQALIPKANVRCEISNKLKCEAFLKHYWKSLSLS